MLNAKHCFFRRCHECQFSTTNSKCSTNIEIANNSKNKKSSKRNRIRVIIEKNEMIHIFTKIKSTKIDKIDENFERNKKVVDCYCVKYHESHVASLLTNDQNACRILFTNENRS